MKPSHQRAEIKGQELHHFHGYAVRDRVGLSGLSDETPYFTSPDAKQILPSNEDMSVLKEKLAILYCVHTAGTTVPGTARHGTVR